MDFKDFLVGQEMWVAFEAIILKRYGTTVEDYIQTIYTPRNYITSGVDFVTDDVDDKPTWQSVDEKWKAKFSKR